MFPARAAGLGVGRCTVSGRMARQLLPVEAAATQAAELACSVLLALASFALRRVAGWGATALPG